MYKALKKWTVNYTNLTRPLNLLNLLLNQKYWAKNNLTFSGILYVLFLKAIYGW